MLRMPTTKVTDVSAPQKEPPPPTSGTGHGNTQSWTDFTQDTTFHGVKYIFEKSEVRFRRFIWLLVVFTALACFLIQVGIRTGNYFEYKTIIDVRTLYKDRLEFPAVTICNQNRHRTTAVVKHGLYDVVDEVFKTTNVSKIPWETFGGRVNGIDYGEFTLQTGHQIHEFIAGCTWNDADCDIDKDFKVVLTDLGLCYTFNGQNSSSTVSTHKAGAGSGLKLFINVEQYEYMRGPQDDTGIKILLHHHEERPIMKEQGFAAAPGAHTLLAITRTENTILQPPYGPCHPHNSPVSQCQAQCQARQVNTTCGCQTQYMQPSMDNATIYCDFKTALSCVRQTLDEMSDLESVCDCSPPCKQVHFEPHLSYAQLSQFKIERFLFDHPDKQKQLEESHLKALDTNQRSRKEIKVKDTADMTRIVTLAKSLQDMLQDIHEKTTNTFTTSRYFNLPAILDPQTLNTDIDSMKNKMESLEVSASDWYWNVPSYMLYNMNFTGSSVLEWDGSAYRFPEFLNTCLLEVEQQNASTHGSVDMDSGLSNDTNLLQVSGRCEERLKDKVAEVNYFLPYFYSLDFDYAIADYNNLVASIFKNSNTSPDVFSDHHACQQGLDSEVLEMLSELYKHLESLSNVKDVEDALSTTNKMVVPLEVLYGAQKNLTRCSWVSTLVSNITDQLRKAADDSMQSIAMFMEVFDTMSEIVASRVEELELQLSPTLEALTGYMNQSLTKLELAHHMISPYTDIAIQDLFGFGKYGSILITSLQEKLGIYKNSLIMLYVTVHTSVIPLLAVEDFQNTELLKLAYATNRTEHQQLIDGLSANLTNMQQLLDKVFSEYALRFQESLDPMPRANKELADPLVTLCHDLEEYAESASLDVNFYMYTFLQLDIFYKDMSYQVIDQQEAFGLLSLLGEVGGFLGLLLGASVITICELLDHILLKVAARCSCSSNKGELV